MQEQWEIDKMIDRYVTSVPEEDIKYYCEICDCEIYENEYVYKIDGEILCEDCAKIKADLWLLEHRYDD